MKHRHPCGTCHRKTVCFLPECALGSKICPACAVEALVGSRAEHAERVRQGLEEAQATLAEIWRRHCGAGNESQAAMARQALGAVIEAATTMRAADRVNQAETRKERAEAKNELRIALASRSVSAELMKVYRSGIDRDLREELALGGGR